MHAAGLMHRTTYTEQSKAEQRMNSKATSIPGFGFKKKKKDPRARSPNPAVVSLNFGFRIFSKFWNVLSVCIALHCIA